jgi:hypothetical protein
MVALRRINVRPCSPVQQRQQHAASPWGPLRARAPATKPPGSPVRVPGKAGPSNGGAPAAGLGRAGAAAAAADSSALPGATQQPRSQAAKLRAMALDTCVICLEAPSEVVFLHESFAHRCACRGCAEGLATGAPCPLCDAAATAVLRVYSAASKDAVAATATEGQGPEVAARA